MPRLIIAALALAGCTTVADIGKGIDKACVRGRITAVDATELQTNHPDWVVKPNDRVINGDCSELLRALTGRD